MRFADRVVAPQFFALGLLLTLALVLKFQTQLPSAPVVFWAWVPSLTLLFVAAMCTAFNRSQLLMAVVLVSVPLGAPHFGLSPGLTEFLYFGLIPFNFLLLSLYRERGVLTSLGLFRLMLIAGQAAAIYWVNQNPELSDRLPQNIPGLAGLTDFLPLTQFNSILLLAGIGAVVLRNYFDSTAAVNGVTSALVAYLLALTLPLDHGLESYLLAAGFLIAIAIVRDSHNLAYRDELTGLPQRRALNEQLVSLGGRYSVAMLDVDHFKKFNDTHGHDIGDQVLQMVASRIRLVKGGGKAFRYGGEEFSIIFPRKSRDEAFHFLDDVRKSIQDYEMVVRDQQRAETDDSGKPLRQRGSFRSAEKKVSVTISIGVADRQGRETAEEVLKRADEALYRAKEAGRNQVKE